MRLRQLVENVLLYEQVILPTDDFVSLRVLAQAFGPEALAILLDAEILKFRRFKGALAYVGAGNGLSVIKMGVGESKRPLGPMWLPTGVAATAILAEMPGVSPLRAKQIAAKIVHSTREVDLDTLQDALRSRTYASARVSRLNSRLGIPNRDLRNLGIRPDQLRLVGSLEENTNPKDDIDKLMIVARTQLELIAKEQSDCDDLSTLSPVGKILAARERTESALSHLYEITDVPDLGTAVMQGAISMAQIVELRSSRHWLEFSRWFHETCRKEPTKVAKEYVKLLKTAGPLDTPFFKVVRILASTIVGIVSPVAGVVAAAADSFLVPKLKEPSAKYSSKNWNS